MPMAGRHSGYYTGRYRTIQELRRQHKRLPMEEGEDAEEAPAARYDLPEHRDLYHLNDGYHLPPFP
jgi:hypothetical protein